MEKPKIGIVIYNNPDYYPPTLNAIHLLADNYDIILIGRNQDLPHWQYPSNVEVYRLGAYSSLHQKMQASTLAKLWEYINFLKEINKILEKVSLIYSYDPFSYVAVCLSQQLTAKRTPLIYHPHETPDTVFPLTSLSGWVQRLENKWINRANTLVFPDLDRAMFIKTIVNLDTSPVIVPNFPLKSYFSFNINWETYIKNRWQNMTLFYRGSISDTSAMKEIVISAALIPNNVKIKFVGFLTDTNAAELNDCVNKNNQTASFTYLGVLPYEELQSHTLNATIGLALYKGASFDRVACATACNKIYEYAACGLPIITSDFSSYRSYLGSESWVRFADPEDPKSIALAIEDILSNFENYQQMCLAARKAFEDKFNYETVFSPITKTIKELVY
jgi:Glycosyl transferases group 1